MESLSGRELMLKEKFEGGKGLVPKEGRRNFLVVYTEGDSSGIRVFTGRCHVIFKKIFL